MQTQAKCIVPCHHLLTRSAGKSSLIFSSKCNGSSMRASLCSVSARWNIHKHAQLSSYTGTYTRRTSSIPTLLLYGTDLLHPKHGTGSQCTTISKAGSVRPLHTNLIAQQSSEGHMPKVLDTKSFSKRGGLSFWTKILMSGGVLVGGILLQLCKPVTEAKEDVSRSDEKVHVTDSPQNSDGPCNNGGQYVDAKTKKISLQEAISVSRDLVQRVKDETGSPGLVIAVSVDGQTLWSEGLGFADVENRLPCQPETVLRIASISKSITMAAVAKLWENGELDLDKPIQYYLPSFPEKTWNGEKVTITTRQLLSHLSGIRHYRKDYMKEKDTMEGGENPEVGQSKSSEKQASQLKSQQQQKSDNQSTSLKSNSDQSKVSDSCSNQSQTVKDEMLLDEYYIQKKYASVTESLELFKDDPLVHKPGSQFLYTTHGWTIISAVVEAASKVKFEKYLRGMLSDLAMEQTYLEENSPLIYNRGRHYLRNDKGRLVNAPYVDLSYKWAGGGLVSNVLDLVTFGNVMLYSYQADGFRSNQANDLLINPKVSETSARNTKSNGQNSAIYPSKTGSPKKDVSKAQQDKSEVKPQFKSMTNGQLPGYLKPETMKMMWSAVDKTTLSWGSIAKGHYGLGWGVWDGRQEYGFCKHQRFFVSHTGGAIGGSSVLLILPPLDGDHYSGRQSVDSVSNCSAVERPPQGVVVAIVVNMMSVGLNKAALDVAKIFDTVER